MKLLTKLTVMLLTLLMLLGAVNVALAEKEGDFEYTITDGKAIITKYTGKETDLVIPSTLGGMPVVTIGNSAFRGCTRLVSVTIPDSVTVLSSAAFSGCTALTGITIPDSVTSLGNSAFYDCTSLTTITIPDSVTSIGNNAFKGCSSLMNINTNTQCTAAMNYPWPSGVRLGIYSDEFAYLPAGTTAYCLTSYTGTASTVVVPVTYNGLPVTQIDSNAFDKSITLFVTGDIPYVASNPCWRYTVNADGTFCLTGTNITDPSLHLPGDACGTAITSIGDYAFDGLPMSFVYIPDSIVTTGANPFKACTQLVSIIVTPDNTGLYVSEGGTLYRKADKCLVCFPAGLNVSRMTIPEGVRSIGAYAMYQVQAEKIILPDTVAIIGAYAFAENPDLTEINLANGVTHIMGGAFAYCSHLRSVSFPASLTAIGDQAFINCGSLTNVTLPAALTSIGQKAFYNCDALASVTIFEGTHTISGFAFAHCDNLRLAGIPASVTHIGEFAFTGAPLLTLYVQPGSYAAAYARENLLHALYPNSDSWLAE